MPGACWRWGRHNVTVEGSVTNSGALAQTLNTPGATTTRFLHLVNAAGTADKYLGADLTPASGMGSTLVTVYGNQICPGPDLGHPPILRCFEVDPATPAVSTLRLSYLTAELNGNNPATMYIYHQKDDQWEGEEGTYTREWDGGTYDWVQVTGVDEYSPFTAGNHGPTLVELGSFTAQAQPGLVHVAWSTLSEVDNAGFNLWRSQAAEGGYEKLNAQLIPAQGGPTQPASYAFDDDAVTDGVTYYYKLEDVSIYGQSTLHGPVWATAGMTRRIYLPLAVR